MGVRHYPLAVWLCGADLLLTLQIGEAVLRKFVFIHLEQPADKLQLLLAMMHKLYAVITRQCADDNPDALIHHEVSSSTRQYGTLASATSYSDTCNKTLRVHLNRPVLTLW